MSHQTVSAGGSLEDAGRSAVASTSKVTLDEQPDSPKPVFKKRKEKNKRSLSIANGTANNGLVKGADAAMQLGSSKRVKTFHDSADDSEDSNEEEDSANKAEAPPNGHGVESRKQARKRQHAERAAHLLTARMNLPVWHAQEALLKEIAARDTVVVLGETGSGKTTQIPQFLLNSNICRPKPRIAVTQPRRVAATSLAQRVAEEVGCSLGSTVGYTVRFDDKSSPQTRLKYLTDGTLLQEILGDPLLEAYDIVIIDEAHERTLRTDMILGFLKQIQKRRKDLMTEKPKAGENGLKQPGPLKIIVMSATLDAKRFSEFYDIAKVLYVKGRSHKVDIKYLDTPTQDYIEATVKTVFQIHCQLPPGDILVFLAGQDDIEAVRSQLDLYLLSLPKDKLQMLVCPLYARLTPAEQNKAFNLAPPKTRKVILATNVAETSITISGIKYVVDAGMAKEKTYHASTGMDSLLLSPISKSSAVQRAGRAGRESQGMCFRLYTELNYHELRQAVPPEIQRCSLSFALLHLMAAGQQDVRQFDYMDRPDEKAILASLIELTMLGAIGPDGKITQIGRKMATLPLEPRQAKILLSSFVHNCTREVIDVLALLGSADQLLTVPQAHRDAAAVAREKFVHRNGDHLMLLNILRAYEEICQTMTAPKDRKAWCKDHFLSIKTLGNVIDSRDQIRARVERMGADWRAASAKSEDMDAHVKDEAVLRCLLEGFRVNTAMKMADNSYRRINGSMKIKIHPSSVVHGKQVDAIVFSELVCTSDIYARICSSVPLLWLRQQVQTPGLNPANLANAPQALKSNSLTTAAGSERIATSSGALLR